jgi:hypothetical protein
MQFTKHSLIAILDLIDDRIDHMDTFNPRDDHDLAVLLGCREKLKVASSAGEEMDTASCIETVRTSAYALKDPGLMQVAFGPSIDVV